jgi:hypothetical protein
MRKKQRMNTNLVRFLVLAGFIATLSVATPRAEASAVTLQDQVRAQQNSPTPFSDEELKKVQSEQYIFVDGFFGELFNSNFLPAQSVVQENWKDSDTVIIRPATRDAIWDTAEVLYAQIKALRASSLKKKAIIVAHSKGSAETALMMLRHPDLITEFGVSRVALVAGPMGGTDLANLIESNPSAGNPVTSFLNLIAPSLESFLPDVIQPVFTEALAKVSPTDRALLKKTLFYVRIKMTVKDSLSPLLPTHLLLSALDCWVDCSNDGLIPTASEALLDEQGQVFGTDLGTMKGDHNSLLNNSVFDETLSYRKAFFETLIRDILF